MWISFNVDYQVEHGMELGHGECHSVNAIGSLNDIDSVNGMGRVNVLDCTGCVAWFLAAYRAY